MWLWIGLAVLIAFIVLFLTPVGSYIFPKREAGGKELLGRTPNDLAASKKIGNIDDLKSFFLDTNTGTLQAFVYPLPIQRTGQMTNCSSTDTPSPGDPSCSSGRYTLCACVEKDCGRCQHKGYINILNLSNILRLELLAAPDAGRRNAALCQLVVRTIRTSVTTGATETVEETLVLPNLPVQRWTMITIAREGRRFDVYYNAALVLSKRCQYVLDGSSLIGPAIAGDKNLNGQIVNVNLYSQKLSASDVARIYSILADTNGKPFTDKETNFIDYLPFCKDGSCLKGPKIRPASPLYDWDTEYA